MTKIFKSTTNAIRGSLRRFVRWFTVRIKAIRRLNEDEPEYRARIAFKKGCWDAREWLKTATQEQKLNAEMPESDEDYYWEDWRAGLSAVLGF